MESELTRAVVVSVGGAQPSLDLAEAAAALHVAFGCGPMDLSIRAFFPKDFLVLCRTVELRDRMVDRGMAMAGETPLVLGSWLRQSRVVGIVMPFLVQLALVGIRANAWSRRAAQEVLRGIGLVVKVADCTARRSDMSRFRVWLRTDDPDRIPSRRILVVEEPHRRQVARQADGMDAFWYPVEIIREAPPARPSWRSAPPPPPRSPPPPPDSDEDEDGCDGGDGPRPCIGRACAARAQPLDGLEGSTMGSSASA
ncbi:hypothetical protein CFC21_101742, partial [Triticum aestivum]